MCDFHRWFFLNIFPCAFIADYLREKGSWISRKLELHQAQKDCSPGKLVQKSDTAPAVLPHSSCRVKALSFCCHFKNSWWFTAPQRSTLCKYYPSFWIEFRVMPIGFGLRCFPQSFVCCLLVCFQIRRLRIFLCKIASLVAFVWHHRPMGAKEIATLRFSACSVHLWILKIKHVSHVCLHCHWLL